LFDEVVDGGAGFDEEHDATGALQQTAEFRDGVCADNRFSCRQNGLRWRKGTFCFIFEEVINLGDGAVECGDGEAWSQG